MCTCVHVVCLCVCMCVGCSKCVGNEECCACSCGTPSGSPGHVSAQVSQVAETRHHSCTPSSWWESLLWGQGAPSRSSYMVHWRVFILCHQRGKHGWASAFFPPQILRPSCLCQLQRTSHILGHSWDSTDVCALTTLFTDASETWEPGINWQSCVSALPG